MTKSTSVVLLALFCIAALGCAAIKEEKEWASAPTANAAGTWTGTAGTGADSRPVTLTLNQSGTNVTGNLTVAAQPDMSGPVTGSIQGELLKVSLATATFAQMRVQQDTMTGVGSVVGEIILRRQK